MDHGPPALRGKPAFDGCRPAAFRRQSSRFGPYRLEKRAGFRGRFNIQFSSKQQAKFSITVQDSGDIPGRRQRATA